MSVMYVLRDCTIQALANGSVTQCFIRGNTQAAKKKKKPISSPPLAFAKGPIFLSNYCKGPTVLLMGEGVMIHFGKDFLPEPLSGS